MHHMIQSAIKGEGKKEKRRKQEWEDIQDCGFCPLKFVLQMRPTFLKVTEKLPVNGKQITNSLFCIVCNLWKSIFSCRDQLLFPFMSSSQVLIPLNLFISCRYWQKCLNKCFSDCGLFTTKSAPRTLPSFSKAWEQGLNLQQRISMVSTIIMHNFL